MASTGEEAKVKNRMKHSHYKVLTTTEAELDRIHAFLVAEKARVVGASKLFNFIAADDLSPGLKDRLREMGADVVEDFSYAPD